MARGSHGPWPSPRAGVATAIGGESPWLHGACVGSLGIPVAGAGGGVPSNQTNKAIALQIVSEGLRGATYNVGSSVGCETKRLAHSGKARRHSRHSQI